MNDETIYENFGEFWGAVINHKCAKSVWGSDDDGERRLVGMRCCECSHTLYVTLDALKARNDEDKDIRWSTSAGRHTIARELTDGITEFPAFGDDILRRYSGLMFTLLDAAKRDGVHFELTGGKGTKYRLNTTKV